MTARWADLFASAQRAASRGALQQTQTLLEQTAAAAEQQAASSKEQVPILHALGATAQALGRPDLADRHFERAFTAMQAELTPGDPLLAAAAQSLALNRAVARGAGEAASFLEQVLEGQRQALGPTHPEVARTLARLGELTSRAGKHDAGRTQVEQALAQAAPIDTPAFRLLAAVIDGRREAWAQAEHELRGALAEAGPDADLEVIVRLELGEVLARKGDLEGAMGAQRAAVAKASAVSPVRAREARGRLAALCVQHGKPGEALPLLRQNVLEVEDELGPASLPLGLALLDLAAATALAEPAAAPHELFVRAQQVLEVTVGPSALPVARALLMHAETFLSPGRELDVGVALVQRALDIIGSALGHEHPAVAEPLISLAALRWLKGDAERAASLSAHALSLLGEARGGDPFLETQARTLEAAAALASGDPTRAARALEYLRTRVTSRPG